ncbi:hypothetical protein, partial [Desulfolutivibrio sp.]|uniref:hypothetical protein n=1 Tax=Desulfolutivibrio sp. TaxID=2773296 RepID=UPI002FC219AB
MPLTKSDKLIIVGAVVLALAVVAGLAAWRKPHLFTGGKPAPEMTTRDFQSNLRGSRSLETPSAA